MKKVLVTGANGQLGRSIRSLSVSDPSLEFIFTDVAELDIADRDSVRAFFSKHTPDYCINCAAYTQVDQAETERDKCFQINVTGVENLVAACSEVGCVFVHISTDFVFDGRKGSPYTIEDQPNPINVYGLSKYKSEQVIQKGLERYFIIRTSWVYSEYGKNFVKTMIRLSEERNQLQVVNDQFGAPTYAGDLADFLIWLVTSGTEKYGTYHFANDGEISWFEFALEIFNIGGLSPKVDPVSSEQYKTPAKRPAYSVLSTDKTTRLLGKVMEPWKSSLGKCMHRISKTVSGTGTERKDFRHQ